MRSAQDPQPPLPHPISSNRIDHERERSSSIARWPNNRSCPVCPTPTSTSSPMTRVLTGIDTASPAIPTCHSPAMTVFFTDIRETYANNGIYGAGKIEKHAPSKILSQAHDIGKTRSPLTNSHAPDHVSRKDRVGLSLKRTSPPLRYWQNTTLVDQRLTSTHDLATKPGPRVPYSGRTDHAQRSPEHKRTKP